MKRVEPALLKRLELTVLRRVDGLLQGDFEGLLPAQGWETGDARPYAVGDDVRRIDWTVTARTSEPHVRTTIADRELEVTFVVDLSSSMAFGTALGEKHELAAQIVGALGIVTSRGGNRLAALVARDEPVWIPPRSGRQHLHRILEAVAEPARHDATPSLAEELRRASRLASRRGFVIVVSDFLDRSEWERSLRALHDRHTVLAVEVRDPREMDIPPVGVLALVDPETGRRRRIDTNNRKLRERFREAALEQRAEIADAIEAAGVDHLVLRTDEDWVPSLITHTLVARHRARRRTGLR